MISRLLASIRRAATVVRTQVSRLWRWFLSRPRWQQGAIGLVLVLLLGGAAFALTHSGGAAASDQQVPTVTVSSVGNLSGTGSSVSVLGTVRSIAEADLLAQSGGTVTAVHARIGSSVPAGYVIAEVDNATQRAQVLQAEGAYEAALASRSSVSPQDATEAARNAYRTAFSTMDTTLYTEIEQFFGQETAYGPQFLLNQGAKDINIISQERVALGNRIEARRAQLGTVPTRDVNQLLDESEADLNTTAALLGDIAEAAGRRDSNATAAQITALSTARATINGQLAAIAAAREAYRAKSTTSTASVDANAKSALGTLRLAQAALEKTLVRAPIGGTVNFLPIRTGDYVTPLEHVATVAQNGALEIVTYVSEQDRSNLSAGMKVRIDEKYDGIVTTIAPALDPNTKQIEVHVAVSGTTDLENGQAVHVSFADALTKPQTVATSTTAGPLLLPLSALKLTPTARVVFTVNSDKHLVAHEVTVGDVQGDRIEILSGLTPDMEIVSDARGLSEGQLVQIATTTP